MSWRANLDEANHQLESCMRENRTYSSEGGDGESRFRPLSATIYNSSFHQTWVARSRSCFNVRVDNANSTAESRPTKQTTSMA